MDAVDTIDEVMSGRANWRGPALAASPDWIRTLTDLERNEIDDALHHFRAQGIGLEDMTIEHFPLPRLRHTLGQVLEELETGRGFQVLRGLDVTHSLDDLRAIYWGMGLYLGTAVSQSPRHDLIGDVRDLQLPLYAKEGRGYTSNAELSYHSDTTDVSVLLCVRHAKSGGQSLITSSVEVHNEMLRTRPDLLKILYHPIPFAHMTQPASGQPSWFAAPVFAVTDGHFASRFTRVLLRNLDFLADAPKPTPGQLKAVDLLEAIAASPEFVLAFTMKPGDIQFINSHVTFHNRTAFEDWPQPERHRHLLRLWLSVPNSRPLSPALAPVYGDIHPGAIRGGATPHPHQSPRFTTLEE